MIPKGYAFAVILIVEKLGHKLIKLRSPLNALKWDGDWGPSSKLWEPKLK